MIGVQEHYTLYSIWLCQALVMSEVGPTIPPSNFERDGFDFASGHPSRHLFPRGLGRSPTLFRLRVPSTVELQRYHQYTIVCTRGTQMS